MGGGLLEAGVDVAPGLDGDGGLGLLGVLLRQEGEVAFDRFEKQQIPAHVISLCARTTGRRGVSIGGTLDVVI